jgi:hypothetical protein
MSPRVIDGSTVVLADNPLILPTLACLLAGVAFAGLVRLAHAPRFGAALPALVFLVGYVVVYAKIPAFPPIGATNKLFYIGLAGLLLALAAGRVRHPALLAAAVLGALLWIATPRLAAPDAGLYPALLLLWLGGTVVLWRLQTVGAAPPAQGGGGAVALAMVMALLGGFAPLALAGGSSTSLLLALACLAGLGAATLAELVFPQGFGADAALAALGYLAIADTLVLITRATDALLLIALPLLVLATQAAAERLLPAAAPRPRARAVLVSFACAVAAFLPAVFVYLRDPDTFNP